VKPQAPRFKGRVVWINEPSVVSYGETCMAMIADYHLAALVGAPTAGTNGNANFIELPGGYRVMWTGMDVRRHDNSVFYCQGFVPDHPVPRTVQGIKDGRDEYLEKAIAVIEGDDAGATAKN
jgi:C-terminal processing protease CtpA/Prc